MTPNASKKRSHAIHQSSGSSTTIHPQSPPQQTQYQLHPYHHASTFEQSQYSNAGPEHGQGYSSPRATQYAHPQDDGVFAPWHAPATHSTQPMESFSEHAGSSTSFIDPLAPPVHRELNMTMPLRQARSSPMAHHFQATSFAPKDDKSQLFHETWTEPLPSSPPLSEDGSMLIDPLSKESPPRGDLEQRYRDPRRKAIEDKAANKRKTATNRFAKVLANRINGLPENGLANQLHMAANQMEEDGKTIQQLTHDNSVLERKVQSLEAKVKNLAGDNEEHEAN